jgi:hypothetical protein
MRRSDGTSTLYGSLTVTSSLAWQFMLSSDSVCVYCTTPRTDQLIGVKISYRVPVVAIAMSLDAQTSPLNSPAVGKGGGHQLVLYRNLDG